MVLRTKLSLKRCFALSLNKAQASGELGQPSSQAVVAQAAGSNQTATKQNNGLVDYSGFQGAGMLRLFLHAALLPSVVTSISALWMWKNESVVEAT